MVEQILYPAIAAVLGGVITWIVTQAIKNFRQKRLWNIDCRHFSGIWHSIHITKGEEFCLSRHQYDLTVKKDGSIAGTLIEKATNPEWKYKVEGQIGPGGWVLKSQSLSRLDEFAVEIYFNDINSEKIYGFLVSFDLDRQPFCTFTVLSRKKMSEEEFHKEYKRHINRFYMPTEVISE